jgi:hypothetical protein
MFLLFLQIIWTSAKNKGRVQFTKDQDPARDDKHTSIHAHTDISMFDSVLQMLGPDTELLEDVLKEMGKCHRDFGMSASCFP